jgi:hypothetical protein
MKSPPSLKTRVALACLLGGLLFYTCRPRLQELTADWDPEPAVAFFASEAELRAWMGEKGLVSPVAQGEDSLGLNLVEVRREVKVDGFRAYPFHDLSLYSGEGPGFRLIASLPFSRQPRHTDLQDGLWIVNEQDWKVRGWKRLAEVRLDRTEPLIVSASE